MDFEKICMMFTMQEPYYGILLSAMRRMPVKASECSTMGVARSGNVFKLGYNPDFVSKLDIDTTLEIMKHECLHIAFNHLTMWDSDDVSEEEHRLRNIAEDLEVNCYLDINKMKGVNPALPEKFGFDRKLGAREYYRLLVQLAQQKQQQAQAKQPIQLCNGGQGGEDDRQQQNGQSGQNQNQANNNTGSSSPSSASPDENNEEQQNNQQSGSGNSQHITNDTIDQIMSGTSEFDDHSKWPDDMTQEEQELIQQQIEDMLVFAADEVEKACGDIPGEMIGKINILRNKKKPKPVADWKRYMRRYMGNEFSEFIRKSKKRESRRFPDAAGNRHRRKSHILVAIDTSGSVSMPEYQEFFGQIKTLTAVADFHVVECDAIIQHEYDYRGKPNMVLHGGGGTSFQPPIDLFNKDKKKYDALIYFTDGGAWIPNDTPKDTLWVISSRGDQSSRKKYQVNGASVAFIPKQK